jgi:opacity protein-like surface antigen
MKRFSILLLALMPLAGLKADIDLKSLAAEKADEAAEFKKRKFGPYVGTYAGESFGQEGRVVINNRDFPLNDINGSAVFGMEIGKSWRMKKWPLMISTRFEGTFSQTSLTGSIGDFNGVAATNDPVFYSADMNSLMFTLGGSLSLDLWRYRGRLGELTGSPTLGKVLAGFKPYVGAGFGGGQVWFRNAVTRSDSQVNHNGALAPAANAFSIDEFISAWHWYAGLEWTWEDRYSLFAEYRSFNFGDMDDLRSFESDGYLVGFRYRY